MLGQIVKVELVTMESMTKSPYYGVIVKEYDDGRIQVDFSSFASIVYDDDLIDYKIIPATAVPKLQRLKDHYHMLDIDWT